MFNFFFFWFLLINLISLQSMKTLKLLFLIILMSLNLAIIFFFKNLSFLGLMWCLVYLGGMMIIFVYVSFISMEMKVFSNSKMNKVKLFFFSNLSNTFFLLMTIFTMSKLILIFTSEKTFIYKKIFFYSALFQFNNWEIYNQIMNSSPLFILFLLLSIGMSLILILGLLKKNNLIVSSVTMY